MLVKQCQVRDNHSPWYLLKKNVYKNVERANSWKDVETMSSGDTQLGICQQQGDAQPHKHYLSISNSSSKWMMKKTISHFG